MLPLIATFFCFVFLFYLLFSSELVCFSSEEEIIKRETTTDICLQPPSGFSDSRELSEAECDRELKPRKLSAELANLLER